MQAFGAGVCIGFCDWCCRVKLNFYNNNYERNELNQRYFQRILARLDRGAKKVLEFILFIAENTISPLG